MTWSKVLQKIMGEKMIKIQTRVIHGVTTGNASLKEDQDWTAELTFWGDSVPTTGKFQSFLKKLSDAWTLLLKLSVCWTVWLPCGRFSLNLLFALLSLSHVLTVAEESASGGGGGAEMEKDQLEAKGRQNMMPECWNKIILSSYSQELVLCISSNFHGEFPRYQSHGAQFHYYVTSQVKTESISLWNGPNTEAQKR